MEEVKPWFSLKEMKYWKLYYKMREDMLPYRELPHEEFMKIWEEHPGHIKLNELQQDANIRGTEDRT